MSGAKHEGPCDGLWSCVQCDRARKDRAEADRDDHAQDYMKLSNAEDTIAELKASLAAAIQAADAFEVAMDQARAEAVWGYHQGGGGAGTNIWLAMAPGDRVLADGRWRPAEDDAADEFPSEEEAIEAGRKVPWWNTKADHEGPGWALTRDDLMRRMEEAEAIKDDALVTAIWALQISNGAWVSCAPASLYLTDHGWKHRPGVINCKISLTQGEALALGRSVPWVDAVKIHGRIGPCP